MRFIISITLAFTAAISTSTAAVIDFDGLIGGPIGDGELVTSQYSALGVNFFDTYYGGAQANDTLTSRMPGSSAPNILFVDQSGGLTVGQYLEIDFSNPVSDVSTRFMATGDITLAAYNGGMFLGSVYRDHYEYSGLLSFRSAQGITSMRLFSHSWLGFSYNFGIDDLTFTAVPEPGVVGLLVLGATSFLVCRYGCHER
jgi:hypothetical protein